jgi:hypothetical protein
MKTNTTKRIANILCVSVLLLAGGWCALAQNTASSLWGAWVGEDPNNGQIIHFVFTPNGIVGFQQAMGSRAGRYSVDSTQDPAHLDIQWSDNSTEKEIFKITGQEIRVERGDAQTRPQNVDDKAVILDKANPEPQTTLLGDWVATNSDNKNQMMYVTFAQNSVIRVRDSQESKKGTYSIDGSKNPAFLDTTLGDGSVDESIFQITGTGILMEDGGGQARPKHFTEKAVIFKKAKDIKDELSSGNFTVADPPLLGDWVGEEPGGGYVLHFVFMPDGSVLLQQADGSHAGKYAVDLSQSPANLDIVWNDNSGIRAIFSLNDQELHIEGDNAQIRPETFSDTALVLKKADAAFLTMLQGSWIGEEIHGGMAGGNFAFAGTMRLITFASGGVIKSAETGQSKEGTYAIDGNTNPAYLDIKWGSGAVEEFTCRFQSITNGNVQARSLPFKEILIILPGRGEEPSSQSIQQMETYRKVSAEEIKQISATLHLGQDQPQAAPRIPDNSIYATQGQANGTIPYNSNSLQAVPQADNQKTPLQLADGTSVSGDIVSFNDNGIIFRTGEDKYTDRLPWIKFSQSGLKQLAQNPKIDPFVEPFIEPPIDKTLAIASNSQKIIGRWDFNVMASLTALIQTRSNVPSSEMAAMRALWFPAYAKTMFVAGADGQASLNNLPHFKMQPNQPTTFDIAMWEGQWKNDGNNYNVTFASGGVRKSATAMINGSRLTLKTDSNTLVFDRENTPITNDGGIGSTIPPDAGEKPVVQLSNVPPSQPIQKSSSHRHVPLTRYLGWSVAGLVIIGMAIIIFRLIMPRRSNHGENNSTES